MPSRSRSQRRILTAMLDGAALKAHRTLDGEKIHLLHPLAGDPVPVPASAVEALRRRGLIASNMKFPAATYVLTEEGVRAADGTQAALSRQR